MKENLESIIKLYDRARSEFETDLCKMEERERIYCGDGTVTPVVRGDRTARTPHVRNIVAELIESVVDCSVPAPKVSAVRPEDEWLASKIEDLLRCEIDRLPLERLVDKSERTVPIQGGGFWSVYWDSAKRSHDTVGAVGVDFIHPSLVIPEPGFVGEMSDMNYFFICENMTAAAILSRYGALPDGAEEGAEVITAFLRRGCEYEKVTFCLGTLLSHEESARSNGLASAASGTVCGGGKTRLRSGEQIPAYNPALPPLILQKNISLFGSLLGESDVDKISTQQNILKRISAKINDKLIKSGSYITLPEHSYITTDSDEMKIIRVRTPADKANIGVFNMEADITADLRWYENVYEEARQIIGVTDSYQGRYDSSAISGSAKQVAIERTAGRLESKRVMKNVAFAEIYEAIFKLTLAYADEPRPLVVQGGGERRYATFDRYDFLERDSAGALFWNDRFLFSVDSTGASDRGRTELWEMAKNDLAAGAFGPPGERETLAAYWSRLETLRYPGAAEMRRKFDKRKEDENGREEKLRNSLTGQREGGSASDQSEERRKEGA